MYKGPMTFVVIASLLMSSAAYKNFRLSKNLCNRKTRLQESSDGAGEVFAKTFKKFSPILGYYAVMLAPIYGIGLPFFGSMTDFNTVRNRISNNEVIVAPSKFTPNARAFEAPEFNCDANTLQEKFDEVILKQPRITYVSEDVSTRRKEYIQRSLIFRFPDVVTYTTIPISEKKSTLAIHSYSVYGGADLGVNRNRIAGWVRDLVKEVPVTQLGDDDDVWYLSP